MSKPTLSTLIAAVFMVATPFGLPEARAHNEHMLIGRSADGRLKWHPSSGAQSDGLTLLEMIPPGGPISGFSAAIPGFSMVLDASPTEDIYPLAAGADVWVEILRIDPALLMVETPSYFIVNFLMPPEMHVGAGAGAHAHPLWWLDTNDPLYDPTRCTWEVTLVLKDKGTTGYLPSEPIVFRFAAGAVPCPADFDCDGDVDTADLETMQHCATGPDVPYAPDLLPPGCQATLDHRNILRPDLDGDGDVDQADFGIFQRCFSGENKPADANCAP